MKRFLLFSTVVCGLLFGCAARRAHIQWAPSLSQGLTEAKASNRPIVLDFYSPT
ncbi:MAG: hypothetical protein ACE5OR_09155 [bacterium]